MNALFLAIVVIAFAAAAWRQIAFVPATADALSPMQDLANQMLEAATGAVTLSIGLVGVMTLFLGVTKVAEAGGLLTIIAKTIRPLMVRLFPDVPGDHPAMGAMVLNLSCNVLGLGNAATPFGIRAMQELDRLNPRKGVATDAMVMFLALHTTSLALLPTGVVALRAASGSRGAATIVPTTLVAMLVATIAAVIAAMVLRRFYPADATATTEPPKPSQTTEVDLTAGSESYPAWIGLLALLAVLAFIPLTLAYGRAISPWVIPAIVVGFLVFGAARGVRIYEVFIDGAKDGFELAIRIIPYLVAILTAVAMFRASGALAALVAVLGPVTNAVGLPPEVLPMALLRPLSGSGAFAVLAALLQAPVTGPDTYAGQLASTLQGAMDTVFYILAIYCGAIGIRRMRHALPSMLIGAFAGVVAAIVACQLLFA
ncbi:MAG TPA: nucleoside recognition domain-containing protein [Alphaproteobacteria bacterium]|nr:nucleoside recognition domain-containing protein [Alphaproteobacteria bacterium]